MATNSETVTLAEISQKGVIVEPQRTLTFPIPSHMANWTHVRFGLLYSLTDLTDPEAQLVDMSGFSDVNDGTISSKVWFGFSTNSNGVLPGTSGFSGDLFRGLSSPSARWPHGTRVLDTGTLADHNGSSATSYNDQLLEGSSLISGDPLITLNFVEDGLISQFYNQFATLWGVEAEVLNIGASNQSIVFKFLGNNSSGPPARLAYSDISGVNLAGGIGSAPATTGNTIAHNDSVNPRTVPQNIVFHWPIFDRWRLRLHGAVLVNLAP